MRQFYAVFLFIFSLTYLLLLALEIPFLIYYPLTNSWSFSPLGEEHGPAMTWYGLVLAAFLPAIIGGTASFFWEGSSRLVKFTPYVAAFSLAGCALLMGEFFLPGAD